MRAWTALLVATITLFGTTNNSFALEPIPEPGVEKIHAGVALSVAGGLATGLGAGIYMANQDSGKTDDCTACGYKATIFPATLMGIGSAMILTGVTISIMGQGERRRALGPSTTATLSIGPLGGSLRVVF